MSLTTVARDDLTPAGVLDDAVADVAGGEHLAGAVDPPHVVLEHSRVRTADRDRVGVLSGEQSVELRVELGRVVRVPR
jgi:hypothetical protein